jgi:hypothetical protein
MTDHKKTLVKVLDQPVMGFAPWILVSWSRGPGAWRWPAPWAERSP